MNSGAFKSSVVRCAFIGKFSVLVLGLGTMQQATAAALNTQFFTYIYNVCNAVPIPSSDPAFITMCNQALLTGNGAGGPTPVTAVSANLGTVNAGSGAASRKKKGMRVPLDEQQEKKDKGASADGGGWGLLVTPQYGRSNRSETDLENGYQSNLSGLVVGLDYRFSDSFVWGVAVGQTKDKANFNGNVGFLNTSNNTATLYGTWLYSENVTVDGYLGKGKLNLDNQRQFVFGANVSGMMSGKTTGQQTMAGLSTSYQADLGRFNVSPFFNLDYIKTTINSYNESGSNVDTNLMALHYGDRGVSSLTSSLGGRLSTSYGYSWGTLQPSARLAAVHEYQNNATQSNNELVLTPGTGFLVATDAPDRNYLNLGVGVSAALNGGTQLFLDYDKRAQDRLLSSWAVSAGVLVGF